MALHSLLFRCESLRLVTVFPRFCLYRAVKHELEFDVSVAKKHSLVTQNALHRNMGNGSAKSLRLHPTFGKLCVVNA